MGVAMTAAALEPASNLRAEFVERVLGYWHKSRANILAMGRTLIEAKDKLERGSFLSMLADDFPFTPRQAQNFMELARDPRLTDTKHVSLLPVSQRALTAIHDLNDNQFEAGLAQGIIRQDVTEREVRDFQKQITQHETKETGAAWHDVAHGLHRPQAVLRHALPSAPKGVAATNLSELMFLLIQRRHALGLSQAAVDDKIGWAEGLCSKYEILHQDSGRAPSIDAILDYAQGLKCGLALVVL